MYSTSQRLTYASTKLINRPLRPQCNCNSKSNLLVTVTANRLQTTDILQSGSHERA